MPLLTDGNPVSGWFRERKVLKFLLEKAVESSEYVKNYVKGISKVTGLPESEVLRSRPVRNFIERVVTTGTGT